MQSYLVWAKCAKLTGLGQMCKVIWFGPNVQNYLAWAKCGKLSGLGQIAKLTGLGQMCKVIFFNSLHFNLNLSLHTLIWNSLNFFMKLLRTLSFFLTSS